MNQTDNFDILLMFPAKLLLYKKPMMPLGLLSIAAVLEKENYRVKVIDFNFYKGNLTEDLLRWNPKVVGIGGASPTRKGSFKLAKKVKEVLPGTFTVYGGPHATFTVQDTLINIPEIDFIIKGEGEFSFLDLCNNLIRKNNTAYMDIPGLCYRTGNEIVENKAKRIDCLDELPMPARHLLNDNYPLLLQFSEVEADFIITSRGCPVCCSFCSASKMFPGGVRLRSIDSVKSEIDSILEKKKIGGLKIFDSTFTSDRSHVQKFCEMIKPYNLKWECEIRADSVDYSLLEEMKNAGCVYVDIGFETTSERLLKKISKRITVEQVENVLGWCKQLNIRTKVFFIFGHIGQTFSECLKDVSWIRKHRRKIDFFANSWGVRLYPGTLAEQEAKKISLLPEKFSWAKYKPPLKNLILAEFDDVIIIDQKQLSFYKILIIAVMLSLQLTNLSPKLFFIKFFKLFK